MVRILVVEDSRTQAVQIRGLLEAAKFDVDVAVNGAEALRELERSCPDVVLTDLDMPVLDGLQLVKKMRVAYPSVPVILMTALGSEDIAMQALRSGAASYIPKRSLELRVVSTVTEVVAAATTDHDLQRLFGCLSKRESHFRLPNDETLIGPLVSHLQDELARVKLVDEMGIMQMTIAMNEVLDNAIFHGNLELVSVLRDEDRKHYRQLAEQRRIQPPYKDRYVSVETVVSTSEFVLTVKDEGPGFDVRSIPDPTDPSNLEKPGGRGLVLIHTFMDEVYHNDKANEITMIKRATS